MIKLPRKIRVLTLAFIFSAVLPIFIHSNYILHIFVLIGIWIILTVSLNLVTGFAGQLSLGHAAFVSIGGYTGALLMLNNGWPFWPALLIGGGTAFVSGLVLGLLALRLRGDYLGMVTLGFGEIIRILAINLVSITRGPMALPGIPRPVLFGYTFRGEIPFFYLMLVLVFFTQFTIERILFSRFGRACLAIREDEAAAEAMGIQSYSYKVLAFCLAAGYAGLAGAFYASWAALFSPDAFTLTDSIMVSVMETLGGIGSLEGVIPGAVIIGVLPEVLRPLTTGPRIASLRLAGVGLLMVIMLIVKPEGISGMSIRKTYLSLEPVYGLVDRAKKIFSRREAV